MAQETKIITFNKGTTAEWNNQARPLDIGEPGYNIDTGEFKIGNGVTPWGNLPKLVTLEPSSEININNAITSPNQTIKNIVHLTEQEYENLENPNASTLYVVGEVNFSWYLGETLIGSKNIPASGIYNTREVINVSGTWTAPVTGWYKIEIRGAGGGGGGGGGASTNSQNAGGGGGGAAGGELVVRFIKFNAGESIPVIIGAGGVGGARGANGAGAAAGTSGSDGQSGGTTSINVDGVVIGARGGVNGGRGIGATPTRPGQGGTAGHLYAIGTVGTPGTDAVGRAGPGGKYPDGLGGSGGNGGGSGRISDGVEQPTAGENGQNGVVIIDYFNPAA